MNYARKITAVDAIASLAWTLGPPLGGRDHTGAVMSNTTVRWNPVKNAAGYCVYWRKATAPLLIQSESLRNLRRPELGDVSTDNYVLGAAKCLDG